MMRPITTIIALAALLPIAAVQAAPPANSAWSDGEFAVGAPVYPMRDTQLLSAPNLKAKPIATIKLSDGPLTVLEKTTGWAMLFGVKDNFYKVRLGSGPEARTGYIYAGWLAKSTVVEDLDGDGTKETIRFGWHRREGTTKNEYLPLVEAEVIRDGKIVASTVFNPIGLVEEQKYNYSVEAKAIGGQGLTGARLIQVGFEYGACDYPNGQVLLIWANGKLQKGITSVTATNEQGGIGINWLFPKDKGGLPDRIVEVETTINRNEEGKVVRHQESRRIYRWDGKTLTQAKATVATKR